MDRTAAFISKTTNKPRGVLFKDDLHPREEWMKNTIPDTKNPNSLNTRGSAKISLNKDKRWLLPQMMKTEVEDREQRNDNFVETVECRGKKKCKSALDTIPLKSDCSPME